MGGAKHGIFEREVIRPQSSGKNMLRAIKKVR